MKNDFFVDADVVKIYLKKRNGDTIIAIVDAADMDRVRKFRNSWCYAKAKSGQIYVVGTLPYHRPNKRIPVYLHRWILDTPSDLVVDHINRNPLDNRRSNLRICTRRENSQNMGANSLSTTKIRGVYFEKQINKWRAQITVNGKSLRLGCFSDIEDAILCVRNARAYYMPFSQEAIEIPNPVRPVVQHAQIGVSGYRNVHWVKNAGMWQVRFIVNKTAIDYGYFHDVQDAAKCADEIRSKISGEFH